MLSAFRFLLNWLVFAMVWVSIFAQGKPLLCSHEVTTTAVESPLSAHQADLLGQIQQNFPTIPVSNELFLMLDLVRNHIKIVNEYFADPDMIDTFQTNVRAALAEMSDKTLDSLDSYSRAFFQLFINVTSHLNERYKQDTELTQLFNVVYFYFNTTTFLHAKLADQTCGLSDTEMFAIHLYTGGAYRLINSALRGDENARESVQPIVVPMLRGLRKIAPFVGITLRGSELPAAVADQHYKGNPVLYQAFTSASDGKPFPSRFKFVIQSKSGRYIAPLSAIPGEEEVLFFPNTRFLVTDRQGYNIQMQEE